MKTITPALFGFGHSLLAACRSLRRAPAFAIVSTATVGIGIAALTAIFSIAEAVVFRPLPFQDESRLVWIWATRTDGDKAFFSIADFEDYRRASRTIVDAAAISPLAVNMTGSGEPERIYGAAMTANFFPLLGVKAIAGRLPIASDDAPGAAPVAVISYGLWQRRFGGAPDVVGRVFTLNGVQHTVVGVTPANFIIPNFDTDIIVAQSLPDDPRRANRGAAFLRVIARLKPDVAPQPAQAEWAALVAANVEKFPDTNAKNTAPRFVPLRDELVGEWRAGLFTLLVAAALLVAVMCANLAGLIFARGLGRVREAAIQSALGASPSRLTTQFLLEGCLVSLVGGAAGIGLVALARNALIRLAPAGLPRLAETAIDFPTALVAGLATVVIAALVSIWPSVRVARLGQNELLKNGPGGSPQLGRTRGVLVAAQIAMSVMMLVAAGLLVRSLHNVLAASPGFSSRGVLTLQLALRGAPYKTMPGLEQFVRDFSSRLQRLPGVQAVAVGSGVPLSGANAWADFSRLDQPPPKPGDTPGAQIRYVGEDFFSSLQISLQRGRAFSAFDTETSAPVAIVDEALVRKHWRDRDPIGQRIRINDGGAAREAEVVGVVAAARNASLDETPAGTLYAPYRQIPKTNFTAFTGRLIVVVKTDGEPLALAEAARRALREIDPSVPVVVRSCDQLVDWTVAPRKFNVHVIGFFAATALLLAAIGLHAITVQSVNLRTREIGIRIALGADRRRVVRLIFGEACFTALAGIALGLGGALALGQFLQGMLTGVPPYDPPTFLGVALVVFLATVAACWVPTYRATRVDPLVALRSE